MKIIIVAAIVISAAIAGYFLFKGEDRENFGQPADLQGRSGEIIVTGKEFSFAPSQIIAKAGEKISIVLKNEGGSSHNLIIEGLNLGTKIISAGESDAIEFIPSSRGEYKIFCSIPGHREAGMEGIIKVE